MRFHVVIRYAGLVLLLDSLFMLIGIAISIYDGVDTGFFPLLMSFVLTTIIGLFPLIFVNGHYNISKKEGYAIVVGSWTLSSFVGILPYILWGGEFTFVNAWFESVSGYTTTGATVLSDVEALPRSLLFWRSSTHLIGGAGVVIFALALVPMMSRSRITLSSVELSPFVKDSFNFKVQKAVRILLYVYLFLVVTLILFLRIAGMSWFDAVNHAFSTVATGGFSTYNDSIAHFNSIWIELILMVYMVFSGIHFGLLYSSITTRRNNIFRSEVTRYYFLSVIVSIIIVTISLWTNGYYEILRSLRLASFQVISIVSTTGFATIDTAFWPSLSIMILIFLSFQCACAGSTAGGMKADRIVLLFKTFKAQFKQLQHPNAIVKIKFSNIKTSNDLIISTLIFALLFIITLLAGTIFSTAMGVDIMTSFSANLACISTIGPGFGDVSSLGNYSTLPDSVKFSLTLVMLAGRLELFGFFQLFLISSWK